jgi:hypothetical protein
MSVVEKEGQKIYSHRRYRGQGELSERGVVLAVDTLTLEDGELNSPILLSVPPNRFRPYFQALTAGCLHDQVSIYLRGS